MYTLFYSLYDTIEVNLCKCAVYMNQRYVYKTNLKALNERMTVNRIEMS